jgi:hypothetical protein
VQQPTGVATFVLTDMVDSTAMWDAYPQAMAETLAKHDAPVDEVIAFHRGVGRDSLTPQRR